MMASGEAALARARAWIGTPYVHQAAIRGEGCDCLGLVRGVWREVYGTEPGPVPPYTPDWSECEGREALFEAAARHLVSVGSGEPDMPGMALLFRLRERGIAKHLGILARTGADATFVHAYTGHGVLESPLSLPWRRRIVARFSFPEVSV